MRAVSMQIWRSCCDKQIVQISQPRKRLAVPALHEASILAEWTVGSMRNHFSLHIDFKYELAPGGVFTKRNLKLNNEIRFNLLQNHCESKGRSRKLFVATKLSP
jgi:hypothetical protein